ncbi:MAG: DNA gyrase subunit A [Thermomicrobiales bacterium]
MVIELKRDAQPLKVLNNLFKHTSLQQSFGVNMLALVERRISASYSEPATRASEYIGHRQEVVVRRAEYELERARRRAHILEGLLKALDSIDQIIATIRASGTTEEARSNLMSGFGFTEIQANAILDMRLARLAGLERQKIEDEYKEVMAIIAELEALLADPQKVLAAIKQDLAYLKEKYGDERRTIIQDVSSDLSVEDLIPEVDVLVTMTNRGYVKRIPADVYRTQRRGGKGVTGLTMRDEDGVQHILAANTMDSCSSSRTGARSIR